MFGDIVKVTPFLQGGRRHGADDGLAQGMSRADVEDPKKDVSFPESVVDMLKGDLGQPPGGWPGRCRSEGAEGREADHHRPGDRHEAGDLEKTRAGDLSEELEGFRIDDEDLCGYLMYPKVFLDYMGRHRVYGPVRTLPTPVFFYGMEPGQEISVEIDPGKTLEIRLQAIGDTNEEGRGPKVFFELNGQPRIGASVPDRAHGCGQHRGTAPQGRGRTIPPMSAPPCPALWPRSTVTAQPGQAIEAGDVLLSIEAMKMETMHPRRTRRHGCRNGSSSSPGNAGRCQGSAGRTGGVRDRDFRLAETGRISITA